MPVRAWKATAPDSTGHRGQIAGNCGADRRARPTPPAKPITPSPPRSCRTSPRGAQWAPRACARERRHPPAGRGAVLRVTGRHAAGYGDTAPHGQRPAELHNPRITQRASYPASSCAELFRKVSSDSPQAGSKFYPHFAYSVNNPVNSVSYPR